MKYRGLFFLLATSVTGCASMSPEDCARADWHAYGYEDGTAGRTMQHATRRGSACTKHGFAMDHTEYDSGRHEGLANYCTTTIAYDLGEQGAKYNGVCKDHNESEFLSEHGRGYEMFSFVQALKHSEKELGKAKNRHAKLNSQLNKYTAGYRDEGVATKEHNKKMISIVSERKWLANEAIPYWTIERRYAVRELEGYRDKVAAKDSSLGNLRPRGFEGPRAYPGPNASDAFELMAELYGKPRSR